MPGSPGGRFPHSLEFDDLPLSQLMKGPGQFDWKPLDDKRNDIASRSCQPVFRIWIEDPGQPSDLLNYPAKAGVKVTTWEDRDQKPPQRNFTPDYDDERLVVALEEFSAELGARYDKDERIGFLTTGLLGMLGE
jgi:hypothetical protein